MKNLEKNFKMKVKEIMNKVIAIDSDISLKEAAKIMSKKNIGSLVVLKGSKVVGIITEKDIIDNVSNLNKKVYSVMKKNVYVIEADSTLEEAARIMAQKKVRRLPVVENGKLVGIITSTDLIANSEEIEENFFID